MKLPPLIKPGPPSVLTDEQRANLWQWYVAKREIGTYKSKALEMGVDQMTLRHAIQNLRRREARA